MISKGNRKQLGLIIIIIIIVRIIVIIRPPGTMSSGRAYVLPVMYFFLFRHSFSELPRPIALKLCHMVGIWLNFIIPLQKLGER